MSSRYLQHGSDGAGPNGEHELMSDNACLQQRALVCYVPDTGLARGERVVYLRAPLPTSRTVAHSTLYPNLDH